MRRRDAITLLGATALARALPATAQQLGRPPVVGLVFTTDPNGVPAQAFVNRMRDLGWIEGRTVSIERRTAEKDPLRLSAQFAQLRALGAKVNVVAGARWMQETAGHATGDVPVITLFHEDPVAAGLIASLARPGGNITGVTSTTGPELYSKRLQFFAEIAPGPRRIALLGSRNQLEQSREITLAPGLTIIPVQVERAEDYDAAFSAIIKEEARGLMVAAGPINYVNSKRIVTFASNHKLPAIYANREAVEEGGLMSYGPSIPGAFRQMAGMADRLLKGERPGDIPVEQPTLFELVINAGTANRLGFTIPPTMLAVADEVID